METSRGLYESHCPVLNSMAFCIQVCPIKRTFLSLLPQWKSVPKMNGWMALHWGKKKKKVHGLPWLPHSWSRPRTLSSYHCLQYWPCWWRLCCGGTEGGRGAHTCRVLLQLKEAIQTLGMDLSNTYRQTKNAGMWANWQIGNAGSSQFDLLSYIFLIAFVLSFSCTALPFFCEWDNIRTYHHNKADKS